MTLNISAFEGLRTRHFRRIFCMFLAAFSCFSYVPAAQANSKYASIIMDADTGQILDKSYPDKILHPASLTKMMTLLLVFEALEDNKLSYKRHIQISRNATNVIPSKLGLAAGSSIRVEDAIYALVTKSANDIAVALAEHLGGTEENFAMLMTKRARELGMTRTFFKNASGLHDPEQVSTARDMAKLARTIITQYPQYYRYFSTQKFHYQGKTYISHNKLMSKYPGMDGMKTGYIGKSGFNLVASAVRDNKRLIGVVFGGRTARSRDAHMKDLLDRAFSKVEIVRIAQLTPPVPARKPDFLIALAGMNETVLNRIQTGGSPLLSKEETKWALLNPALHEGMFSRLIGEGDYDPAVSKRLETGLLAIASLKGEKLEGVTDSFRKSGLRPAALFTQPSEKPWSIQVGVFGSRARTDQAITLARSALPSGLSSANPIIVPMRTNKGLMFRARLTGYTKAQAQAACSYLSDCMEISPK